MRLFLIAAAATALAACAPAAAPEDTAALGPAACAAQGGEIRRVGRLQAERCVILYADAGRPCTDGSQCQGDCRLEGSPETAATPAAGICQADSSPFGCHTTVVDGRPGPTLCVD